MILTSVSMTSLTASVDQYISAQLSDSPTSLSDDSVFSVEREEAAKIDAYFADKHLPLAGYGTKFVTEAKKHGLPYNLLAGIAMAESTGCKFIIPGTNNCFGWGSGKIKFTSIDQAIEVISSNLGGKNEATDQYYDGKTVKQILEAYNPPKIAPHYTSKVLFIMESIDAMNVK